MPTHGPRMLTQAACKPRRVGNGQRGEGCLERRSEYAAILPARSGQGTLASLARLRSMMRTIAATFRALPVRCHVTTSCRAGIVALAAIRVACAAAHHQMHYQHCDTQNAEQLDHTTPIPARYPLSAATFYHLQVNWPARRPSIITCSTDGPKQRYLLYPSPQQGFWLGAA